MRQETCGCGPRLAPSHAGEQICELSRSSGQDLLRLSLEMLHAQHTGASPALAEGTGGCFSPWIWRAHVIIMKAKPSKIKKK